MSTFLYILKTLGQQLVWEIVKRTVKVHSVSHHMLVATKQCTCTRNASYLMLCKHDWTRVQESGHRHSASNWNCAHQHIRWASPYKGSHFILTLFVRLVIIPPNVGTRYVALMGYEAERSTFQSLRIILSLYMFCWKHSVCLLDISCDKKID